MKKITILISLLAILAGYLWAQPLLAQAPIPRPTPDREAMDAGGPWGHRPPTEPTSYALTLPLAPASAIASWSKIVYQNYAGSWDVYRMNGDSSQPTRLTSSGGAEITPRLNRGATRLVYAISEPGNYEIYAMNVTGSGVTRLTNNSANDYNPAWSPDGTKIVFNSYRDGQSEVYVMNADGSGQTRLTFSPDYDGEPVWSPDGSKIAFVSIRDMGQQIYTMKPDGTNVTRITATNASEFPCWSPDSSQLAFSADPDGDSWLELMVINADGTNVRSLADTGTTADLWARSWSPDGRFIANTLISFINYQGNWYWTNSYLTGFDLTTNQLVQLGTSDVAWHPDWQSTDLQPPTSSMTALPATSPSPIVVRWSGSDAGPSGMLGYDVQVKDGESGTWTTWLTRSAGTSGNYPGVGGHTYYFRARAWDQSGNAEAWPANAETSTTVEALPPTSVVSPLPTYWRGALTVTWGGSDPGGSGIATYDIQYQDGTGGDWANWQTSTTATAATFNGTVGHSYTFRVKAMDRAQNLGEWSVSTDKQTTTFYSRQISGMVFDGRGRPLVGTSMIITPSALNIATSTAHGYSGYFTNDDQRTITAHQTGFGTAPIMTLTLASDVTANHWLPPSNNTVRNGNFENEPLTDDWYPSGNPLPSGTNTSQHSGRGSATLGIPFRFASPQDGWLNESIAADVDTNGAIHLIDIISVNGNTQHEIRYSQKSPSANAFTPPVPVLTTQPEWSYVSYPSIIADSQGGIHLTGRYSITSTGISYIFYCYKTSGSSNCTTPTVLGAFYGAPFQVSPSHLALDRYGGLHLVWVSGSVKYAYRSPAGIWAPVETISGIVANATGIAIDNQDIIHVVWEEWINTARITMYRAKSLPGNWGTAIPLETTSGRCDYQLATTSDNNLHVLSYVGNAVSYSWRSSNGDWSEPAIFPANGYHCTGGMLTFDVNFRPVIITTNEPHLLYHYLNNEGQWHSLVVENIGRPQWFFAEADLIGNVNTLWTLVGESIFKYTSTDRATGNADFSLTQVITIPSNLARATASIIYESPDQLTSGNRLQIKIAEAASTTEIASVTSPSNHWQHIWGDVSQWAGQTVTLTINWHQESGQPFSHIYLDEISLGSWLTPDPQAVTPKQVEATASTVITITGDNFIAPVQVRLNDTPLPNATWINTNTITATAPLLPFGRYDVIVTNPGGQASGLPNALLVGHEVLLPLIRK